jgi:L-threonate 2-dehydrogenase
MEKSVAIIGVGNMGGGMAQRLLSQGWRVTVCDTDSAKTHFLKEKSANVSANPSYCAIENRVFIICVVDALQTHEVLYGAHGLAASARRGDVVLLCPTLSPACVEQFAQQLSAQGIHTIDAPMSGGPARATDGSMSLMLACADAVFDEVQPLLDALSNKLFRISTRVGDGARTKLVNNLLAGINLVGAAEVMALADKMGLNLTTTLAVIEQSSGQSWIGSDRMHRALAGDYSPRAHMTLLEKDTRLATEAAASVGYVGPLGAVASSVFEQASKAGLSGQDDAALFKHLAGR